MSKKKVTAPLTYNPGKGRPKEHLAYLNYQEMQALKRLNGNNQERGPKGLPSFPPADAIGSSSKASSKSSGTTTGKTTTKSSGSTGSKGSGTSTSWGGSSKANTAGKDVGGGNRGGGGGAGPRSGVSGTRSPTSGSATGSGKGPSMSKDTGGKSPAPRSGLAGTRSPTSGSKLSSSGQKPGGIADIGGGKRAAGDTPGTKIKGAIQQVKQQTYQTAPRYKQPQAERMANPTAVPTMERTVNERLNMADAARKRAATASAQLARTGPFGPTDYTGTYNPKTGQYNARPTAATPSVPMDPGIRSRLSAPKYSPSVPGRIPADPSFAGRIAQAEQNYKTVTGPGGMVSKVYSDPDIKGPTLGETISDYASRVADAVFGPDTQKMAQQYTESFTDFGDRFSNLMKGMTPNVTGPQKYQDRIAPSTTPQRMYDGSYGPQRPAKAYYDRIAPTQPAAPPRQFAERTYSATAPQRVYDQPDLKTELAKAAVRMNEMEQTIRAEQVDPRLSAEQTLRAYEEQKRAAPRPGASPISLSNPVSISYNADPDVLGFIGDTATSRALSGFGNVAPARETFQGRIEPMGYSPAGEKILAVENVPEAGIAALGPMQDYPKYVSPEVQEEMRRQDKLNKAGIRTMKIVDRTGILRAGDALLGTFTGKGIAERTADLKRSYMQSDAATRAQMEAKYPNLTKFANDAGVGSQLPASNYSSWAQKTGLTGSGARDGGGDRGGIASLTVPTPTVAPTPTESTTGTQASSQSGGGRPYIHFQWDLGLNVPAPTDPNYADYQKYLANRAASAAALESA